MGQGNPDKVNAIVDQIVEGNILFKSKSPIEQDKEKDSIAQGINTALAKLNETGKKLVLDDLSVDPEEKFKGFIDNGGNVDLSGITKFTATIVKAKIEEAEREGINLNSGEPIFKDNKITMSEGVLTIALIDSMIKDYDHLSDREIQTIIKNYSDLPPEMQNAFNNKQADKLDQIADTINDEKTKQALKEQAEATRDLVSTNQKEAEEFSKSSNKTQIIINIYREVSQSILELGKIYKNDDILRLNQKIGEIFSLDRKTSLEELLSQKSEQELIEIFGKLQNIRDEFVHQANEAQREISKEKENETPEEKKTKCKEIRDISLMVTGVTNDLDKNNFPGLDKSGTENAKKFNDKVREADKNPKSPYHVNLREQQLKPEDLIKAEIEQIPNALMKSGFSKEQIKEILKTYIGTLKSLESDDIEKYKEYIKHGKKAKVQSEIKDFLIEDGINSPQLAEILSKIDYNGNLLDVLSNEEQRKEFFEHFDQVINQEQIQSQDVQLTGELEEIFTQYFNANAKEMDVSLIEEQKKQQAQEQSEQETIAETKDSAKEEQKPQEKVSQEFYKEGKPKETVGQPAMPEEHTQDEKQDMESVVEAPMESATSSVQAPPEEHTQKPDDVQNQEVESQETALVELDFLVKLKRTMAKIKSSIQTKFNGIFGKNEKNAKEKEDMEDMLANGQSKQDSKKEQQSFIPQATVNERLAVSQTEHQKNEKQAQTIVQDENNKENEL